MRMREVLLKKFIQYSIQFRRSVCIKKAQHNSYNHSHKTYDRLLDFNFSTVVIAYL